MLDCPEILPTELLGPGNLFLLPDCLMYGVDQKLCAIGHICQNFFLKDEQDRYAIMVFLAQSGAKILPVYSPLYIQVK